MPGFVFDNSYARDLEGLFVAWKPATAPAPQLLRLNHALAEELGLDAQALAGAAGLQLLAGNQLPAGAQPLAQAYAGHQFGGFSPQLGDGRALLLGEVIDRHGQRRDIAFKGSGRTPFSRGGDGKAALGPVLREYLVGEAMHALGIPTTRALAAVSTGEKVLRSSLLPGAILTRVAASHVRVGTFQYFAARDEPAQVKRLADYVINRHDPELASRTELAGPDGKYLALLQSVCRRQAALIARWMGVGFIHGVMNTDNMTLSGETIDYGPCAFMEAFDPEAVFSSIDSHGRYAYANQPGIAQWNLARLAETLLPLLDASSERATELATTVINDFPKLYQQHWLTELRRKLALTTAAGLTDEAAKASDAADLALGDSYLKLLHTHQVDFTLGFRRLADASAGHPEPLLALFGDAAPQARAQTQAWLQQWQKRLQDPAEMSRTPAQVTAALQAANPIYIPRNHILEAALSAAVDADDLQPFERLLAVVQSPFEERPADAEFAQPAAAAVTANYQTFCGT